MTTGLNRRLHNQAKPSLNARIQVSERRLLRERKSLICIGASRPRTHDLEARKEYNRSVKLAFKAQVVGILTLAVKILDGNASL